MFLFLFIFSKFQFKIPCGGKVICGKKLQLAFKREKNFRLRKLRLQTFIRFLGPLSVLKTME